MSSKREREFKLLLFLKEIEAGQCYFTYTLGRTMCPLIISFIFDSQLPMLHSSISLLFFKQFFFPFCKLDSGILLRN